MIKLPLEIFLLVIENLSIKDLWQYRRVSRWWKEQMEMGILNHIKYNPLILGGYLLNASGGPWFTFSKPAIESQQSTRLVLTSCDFENKLLTFQAEQDLHLSLYQSDRLSWCVKCDISVSKQSKLFTLVAPDTPLNSAQTLTTIDMLLHYEIISNSPNAILLRVDKLTCTFSFIFARYYGKDLDYGSYSVFSHSKRDLLIKKCTEVGLVWNQSYWYFGVVLHWLSSGEADEIDGVVQLLLEHESFIK